MAMHKLSELQRKQIIAEYASGEASKAALARKYGVSHATIRKVIDCDADFCEKVSAIKNKAEKSVAERIRERLESKADGLLEVSSMAIERLKETIGGANTRDAAGALKLSMDALMAILDRAQTNAGERQSEALAEFVTALKAAAEAHKDD